MERIGYSNDYTCLLKNPQISTGSCMRTGFPKFPSNTKFTMIGVLLTILNNGLTVVFLNDSFTF